jgi:sugar phosphate isomerase/epimerase
MSDWTENTRPPLTRREFLGRAATAVTLAGFGSEVARAQETPKKEAPKKDVWPIGCYTRPWAAADYREALDGIAEAGYRYVGLMTGKTLGDLIVSVKTSPEEAQKIGDACRQRGLTVPSIYGGDIPVEESLEAGIAGLRGLVDKCAVVGAGNLMMGGMSDPALTDRYYQAIAECCPYAQEKGIGISIKPHGGLNATGAQCRRLIEKVGRPNFRLWYDPGNIFYYSKGTLDPVDDAAAVDGLVVGMSVKDFLPPQNVDLTPGTGRVNFPKVWARLRQGGWTGGPLVVECLTPGDRSHLVKQARQVRLFLEEMISKKVL